MALTVTIAGTNRTSYVRWESLDIRRALGHIADSCRFTLYGYAPAGWQEVIVADGATRLFAGYIMTVKRDLLVASATEYVVEAEDYSQLLRTIMVDEHYVSSTDEAIIDDLVATYLAGEGFTTTNVQSSGTLGSISFDNLTLFEALAELAELSGYVWYVDPNKNIYYHAEDYTLAPWGLSDSPDYSTMYPYLADSWQFEEDASDIRNRITVRGGTRPSDPTVETFDGDGSTTIFRFTNRPVRFVISVSVGGDPQSVGTDFVDSPDAFDVYVNYADGAIRFASAPDSGTDNIEVIYTYDVWVTATASDSASHTKFGRWFDYLVNDRTLATTEAKAQAIADSLLAKYADSQYAGRVATLYQGLEPGQYCAVENSVAGVDASFLIREVAIRLIESALTYEVTFGDRVRGLGLILSDVVTQARGGVGSGSDRSTVGGGSTYDTPSGIDIAPLLDDNGYVLLDDTGQPLWST